ncbi:hypothetical protein SAMN05444354_101806 [Stigmatella aurantiaca]|uniref:Uncharacterized protein n=1 Tax=Stigmatella aurantiaca TaxID=41 RepID=A0A1H7HSQ5_STIAU|nr:hypothetical protein [Stigmatella aurantiaca]SEK53208.1 hypothetical protein SAMN05444354_101806 [Stigmatella aurantiaca]
MKTHGKTSRGWGGRQVALLAAVFGAMALMAPPLAVAGEPVPVEEIVLVSKQEAGTPGKDGGPARQGTLLPQLIGSELLGDLLGGTGGGTGGGGGGSGLLGGILGG